MRFPESRERVFGPLGEPVEIQGEVWELSGRPGELGLVLSSDLDGDLGAAQDNADGSFSWICEDL